MFVFDVNVKLNDLEIKTNFSSCWETRTLEGQKTVWVQKGQSSVWWHHLSKHPRPVPLHHPLLILVCFLSSVQSGLQKTTGRVKLDFNLLSKHILTVKTWFTAEDSCNLKTQRKQDSGTGPSERDVEITMIQMLKPLFAVQHHAIRFTFTPV